MQCFLAAPPFPPPASPEDSGAPFAAPASSPSTFLPSWQGIPRRIRAFPLGKPYHQAFPLPCPCSPLIGVRKPHHDWLPCAPGTASPQPPLSSRPSRPTVPLPARPGVRSGRPCPYASPVHGRPFPGFPTKPGCDSFLSPSSDLFRMVGKWIPIHNAAFGIHTAVFNLIYEILS